MEEPREAPKPDPEGEPAQELPGWIALLIGVVLVCLAALAAYTGLRYRSKAEDRPIASREPRTPIEQAGAPGEPQAGAARVGQPGENVPSAEPAEQGRVPRVEITGGPAGVVSTIRYTARRGAIFAVQPNDAIIFVNEEQIGLANQFGGPDEIYEFPAAGKYTVRIAAPGHRDESLILTADPNSSTEVVRITRKLMAE